MVGTMKHILMMHRMYLLMHHASYGDSRCGPDDVDGYGRRRRDDDYYDDRPLTLEPMLLCE